MDQKTKLEGVATLSDSSGVLEVLLQKIKRTPDSANSIPPTNIVIGRCEGVGADGAPLVTYPGGVMEPVKAASLTPIVTSDAGRAIALSFPAGVNGQPLVLGFVWNPGHVAPEVAAVVDGEETLIEARESITLRCGEASITLTADGQILLRGAYISSHSTGAHRIKGAAVKIN
jgi:hypothetical protein